jgi:uncharacterized protein involved in exopolysaccharide biosynthesis
MNEKLSRKQIIQKKLDTDKLVYEFRAQGLTFKEIGKILGFSLERARQRFASANRRAERFKKRDLPLHWQVSDD